MSTLFVVATPIGNLEDVTLRAIRVLGEVECLLAEDTRRTRVLLDRHGIDARPKSLHAHNEAARIAKVLEVLDAGGDVALVSDAGTPLVSDPGERLVEAVIEAGHSVTPVAGASAVIAALSASGLPATPFSFVGFLPRRRGECERLLSSVRDRTDTLVFYESPRRLAATLARLAETLGDRRACVARELTKMHEEIARDSLTALAERFADGARGEITIVVAGASGEIAADPADVDAAVRALIDAGASSREISERIASEFGIAKRDAYARAVAIKGGERDS